MITQKDIAEVLKGYDLNNLTIGVLGGHSGLDTAHGAKKMGFRTVAVCQKWREKTYAQYYKTRDGKGCIDEVIVVEKFADMLAPAVQKKLRDLNTIFIHNRYFWVYFDFEKIEKDFNVPIFGLREGVKLEERDHPNNQYEILKKAGIRIPHIFKSAADIDRLVIVKVNEAERTYERAFFFADSEESFKAEAGKRLKEGLINEADLKKATIEEYVIGAHVNLNYFYSVMNDELELMGTDTRRQTNLDGFLRLTAPEQTALMDGGFRPKMVETGHYAVTMKESLLEKAFVLGERFVATMKKECAPGMIGPFALQGAVVAEDGKEDFVIFDVSMRIPGSPGTKSTPYSGYLYGESMSYGERIALEIEEAKRSGRLGEVLT